MKWNEGFPIKKTPCIYILRSGSNPLEFPSSQCWRRHPVESLKWTWTFSIKYPIRNSLQHHEINPKPRFVEIFFNLSECWNSSQWIDVWKSYFQTLWVSKFFTATFYSLFNVCKVMNQNMYSFSMVIYWNTLCVLFY